ncbi:V-type proton ATPase subunit G-like [Artemia franciscana]|uniref:V-type proton ATPase subunit G-like n=1 Tax=Artemia franciscana TaxID=6661 RepID=UPI0032DAB1BA
MASQTHGIQQLLAAEKKAAERVKEARTRKARRLKQAKDEAQAEIEAYKQERERQFRDFEAKHLGSKEGVAAKIDVDTKLKIEQMNKMVMQNKENVIKTLLDLVSDIKPTIHKNLRVEG